MIVRSSKIRSQRGALFQVLLPMLLVTCIAIAAFAVDFAHGVLLRAQLQNACDAAALSAAQDFMSIQPGPASPGLISKAQGDADAIARANVADGDAININPIEVTYNQNFSASVPVYAVKVTAQQNLNTFFAVIFGHTFAPIIASSTAGVFYVSRFKYADMTEVNVPLAVTIDVNANNAYDLCKNSALQYVKPGDNFQIQGSGTTGSGNIPGTNAPANAAWVALSADDTTATPVAPSSETSPTPPAQWATQPNSGLAVGTDGSVYSTLASAGAGTLPPGSSTEWTNFVGKTLHGPKGHAYGYYAHQGKGVAGPAPNGDQPVVITLPLISDPNGDSDPSSLSPGHQLKVIGTASFGIISTSLSPTVPPMDPDSIYATLINARPTNSKSEDDFPGFFEQFKDGEISNGTQVLRLCN